MGFPLILADRLQAIFADIVSSPIAGTLGVAHALIECGRRRTLKGRSLIMGQAQQKRRAVLIVEDDAELRSLTVALFEDEQVETIECESAEAALATLSAGVKSP
jgi:hypothetical protein